jgi:DNA repair exonuclease SbcCD ATPase subunit
MTTETMMVGTTAEAEKTLQTQIAALVALKAEHAQVTEGLDAYQRARERYVMSSGSPEHWDVGIAHAHERLAGITAKIEAIDIKLKELNVADLAQKITDETERAAQIAAQQTAERQAAQNAARCPLCREAMDTFWHKNHCGKTA